MAACCLHGGTPPEAETELGPIESEDGASQPAAAQLFDVSIEAVESPPPLTPLRVAETELGPVESKESPEDSASQPFGVDIAAVEPSPPLAPLRMTASTP